MTTLDHPVGVLVGVDLGGTATRFVSLNADSRIRRQFTASTPAEGTKDSSRRFLIHHIQELVADNRIGSIGIGASGPIDGEGIVRNPETLPAFSDFNVVDALELAFHQRPTIDNDAVTAAIGEYRVGAGRGADDILMVTLGTGVGVSLVQQGRPFRTSAGLHPEASHMSLGGAPAPCYCGRSTCWEQIASRKALQNAASRFVEAPTKSSADIDEAAALAENGDANAAHLFDEYGRRLGEGLANLIASYAPHRVVVGGSGSNYSASYGTALNETLDSVQGMPANILVTAELGEYGGAIGAALIGASVRSVIT